MQIMHTGRVSHSDNMPAGARVIASSAIAAKGQMWTDQNGIELLIKDVEFFNKSEYNGGRFE